MNIELAQAVQPTANIIGWFFLIASWVTPSFFKQDKVKGYKYGINLAITSIVFFIVALGIGVGMWATR